MDNAPIKAPTFEERITERLKNDIGELISDEELRTIVDRTINKVFFESTTVTKSYNNVTVTPPFIETVIREILQEKVTEYVTDYITNNKDEVIQMVKTVMEEDLAAALMRGMTNFFRTDIIRLSSQLEDRLRKM